MDYEQLCAEIMNFDTSVRFTGVVNDKAELVAGGNRDDIDSILTDDEIGMSVYYTLQRWRKAQNFSYRFGAEKSSITEYDNVTLISLPINKHLFLISTEPLADYFTIIDKVNSLINN